MTGDDGSVSVGSAAVLGLLAVLAAGLAVTGLMVAASSRAQVAADAAALAAAPVTFRPFGSLTSPHNEAARYADLNGARLIRCRGCDVDRSWRTRTVEVEVAVDVDVPGIGPVEVTALAAAEFVPAQLLGAP